MSDHKHHFICEHWVAEVERLRKALEFYADERKWLVIDRTVNMKQTTAIFHTDKPEELPEALPVKEYHVTARLKMDQGKTARDALKSEL